MPQNEKTLFRCSPANLKWNKTKWKTEDLITYKLLG